jgi:SAM-dependent methyltransferase
MSHVIHIGSNLDILPTLPDNSIDSIVTDPPYELGFMGKSWDSTGIAYNVGLWKECLRVLKPGGHLLAFSGSRTYHRMTCAIEDAGFEVRDQMMWVYGSGFPKSHNISKALDKLDAVEEQTQRRFKFTAWVISQGVTAKQIDEATGTSMGGHYTTHQSQPAIMTVEHLNQCAHLFNEIPEWVLEECKKRSVESKNFNARNVLGVHKGQTPGLAGERFSSNSKNITEPNTAAAQQWDGWGTALKPAHEPICLARKPIEGTVAENVVKWGVGGINIDACRVETDPAVDDPRLGGNGTWKSDKMAANVYGKYEGKDVSSSNLGRFPANLMHDGSQEVLELFPDSNGGAAPKKSNTIKTLFQGGWKGVDREERVDFGSGSAARFFYCPKASKSDRDEGCEELMDKEWKHEGAAIPGRADRPFLPSKNNHPTVKPTALMRYLCRLITPPGGTVLDPFNGSGSTGKAAALEGFNYIGIELSPEYVAIAEARIKAAKR